MKTLSPRQFGQAIGVSESSVKRWADEGQLRVERTTGGHRRITLPEAVRFVRESGLSVVKPQVLGLIELDDSSSRSDRASGDPSAAVELRLREALMAGRADEVRAIVTSAYLGGMSVAAMCDGPLRAAMRHIGSLWLHNREGIFIEHRASDLVARSLHQLRGLMPPATEDAPVAVGGAPDRDIYVLPTLMAATTLAAAGWREINLGHNTPIDVVAQAAERYDARLVWLALSVDRMAEQIVTEVADLAAKLAAAGRSLVVGGRAWPAGVRLKAASFHHAGSMSELETIAASLRKPHEIDAT